VGAEASPYFSAWSIKSNWPILCATKRFFAHFHHQINQISGLWSAVAKACHAVLQAEVVIFKQIGTMEYSGVQKARVGFVSASLFGFLDLAKSAQYFPSHLQAVRPGPIFRPNHINGT
jgi:hypothetical protein